MIDLTLTADDIQDWFQAELDKACLTYDQWIALAHDCSRQCGCGLEPEYPTLAWAYKALRPWVVRP